MRTIHRPVVLFALTAVLILGSAQAVLAANPSNISVTVTIENVSVSTTGPIDFGVVTAGSATVSTVSSTVTNDGNVDETYSLNLTDPATWTAVQAAPGNEEYCLSAMFNSAQPLVGDFAYADHALSTTSTSCSATQFAGDQTGETVSATATRDLWFKFEAPSATTVTTQQTIVVTVTAAAA
ncbi:MAG: hypothetical protein AMJ46_09630 [Latescibacteria bacterium DG_63]|nr:MAG: hypothetical protein AMJ46_09630 [Latescibacteria bacterium DG_63]